MAFAQAVLPNRKYHRLDKQKGKIVYLAIYTTKNHFLAGKLTIMILRSALAGLTGFWYDKNLGKLSSCDLGDEYWMLLRRADAERAGSETIHNKDPRPYTMSDLYSTFLFFGLGLILAGVIFLLEAVSVTVTYKRLRALLKMCRYLPSVRRKVFTRL